MGDNFEKNSNSNEKPKKPDYDLDYFDSYFNDDNAQRRLSYENRRNRNTTNRKGLKWELKKLFDSRVTGIVLLFAVILIIVIVIVSIIASVIGCAKKEETAETAATQPVTTVDTSAYKITGVPLLPQDEYLACCETYACTMLLKYLNFDIEVADFVNNYLNIQPVSYGTDGNLYGPDMNSAFAGDIYFGYGINAPGMAKCMNNYLKDNNSKLKAYPLLGKSVESLCQEYILNDIPVMIWATAGMQEPYVKASWIVDYVDENATHKIGDTVDWQMHEHCMVLIGFDDDYYYLNDSVAGEVSAFDRDTFEEIYEQIGTQAIVVK